MLKKMATSLGLIVVLGAIVAMIFGPAAVEKQMNAVSEHEPFEVSDRAKNLHGSLIVGDWHADSALWNRDLAKQYDYGHADIPRMQQGNMALQMFTTVTKSPSGQNYERNETSARDNITSLAILQGWPIESWTSLAERAIFQAEKISDLAKRDPETFMLIESQADLGQWLGKRASNPMLIGGLIGTEGSHALDGDLSNVQLSLIHISEPTRPY